MRDKNGKPLEVLSQRACEGYDEGIMTFESQDALLKVYNKRRNGYFVDYEEGRLSFESYEKCLIHADKMFWKYLRHLIWAGIK